MTSDESWPERAASLASRVLSALLAAWRTIRRAAMGLLAVVIIAAVAALVGYALGRHSVAPKPGEEARLDAVIDSLRQVADWERAQRAILEQKQAAAPAVNIVAPGRVEIVPRDPRISPRMVEIPVEVTQALALERQINASLRVEAAAERARADSAERTTKLARAVRNPWLTAALQAGYDWGVQAPMLGADAGIRVSDRLSVHADAQVAMARGAELRSRVYGRWEFWRWP